MTTDQKIERLINHACMKVPYYMKFFGGRIATSLNEFPILTKQDYATNQSAFISIGVEVDKCITEYTSGSSGIPLKCLKSNSEIFKSQKTLWSWRNMWLDGVCKKKLLTINEKISTFNVHSNTDFYGELNSIAISLRDLSSESPDDIARYIIESSPQWIRGTPSNVYFLSEVLSKSSFWTRQKFSGIKFIELSGEIVENTIRKRIEKVFLSKVANHYGSREYWPIACECLDSKLHLFDENVFCETINKVHSSGEIVITALDLYTSPVIRYNLGDEVSMEKTSCTCGKSGIVISNIHGRSGKLFKVDNRTINSKIFSELIECLITIFKMEIRKYKVIHKELLFFEIYIETNDFDISSINNYTRLFIDENIGINVNFRVIPTNKMEINSEKWTTFISLT